MKSLTRFYRITIQGKNKKEREEGFALLKSMVDTLMAELTLISSIKDGDCRLYLLEERKGYEGKEKDNRNHRERGKHP